MQSRTFVLAVFTSLAAASVAPAAHAFDLTGHWVGKWSCKGFDGTRFTDVNKTSTLAITQTGNALTIDEDGRFLVGAAIPDAAKPNEKGEVALITCGINTVFALEDEDSEVIRASVKAKPAVVKATLKGLGVLENNLTQFGQEIQTCKYSYKRIDVTPPGLNGCPS